jgi:DNA-binding NtrC family response regulator
MGSILVIDADGVYGDHIVRFFSGMDHQTYLTDSSDPALRIARETPLDVAIIDAESIGANLPALVRGLKKTRKETAVILLLSEALAPERVGQEIRAAAFRVLPKPLYDAELHFQVKRAIEESKTRGGPPAHHDEEDLSRHSEFIGQCPAIQKVFKLVARMAKTDASVLILGESGTGKELIARTIHDASLRADGPFVRVNCAALPEQLLESELFGYEKGAFTGADRVRVGRFEHANGGTIFLDEVADMSLMTQAKLLRVCQQKEFERLGSNQTIKTDARILSATNKDLLDLIRKGLFREDLFYRLNVMNIRLPPLRERGGDISLLIHYLLKRLSAKMRKRIVGIRADAMEILARYRWPGNIREMENTIERAVLLAESDQIVPEDIELFFAETATEEIALPPQGIRLEDAERQLIRQALDRCDGVQKSAAALLGVSPRVLNYKLKTLGMR